MAEVGKDGSALPEDPSPSEVRLFLGDAEHGVHEVMVDREALKKVSPFFHCMLSHDMVECKEGKVKLEYVTLEAWKVISAFYFSREELVTLDNVEEMLTLCEMLDMTALKDHCDVFLCRNAGSLEDVVMALKWAYSCQLNKLKEFLLKIVRKAFEDISQEDSFLKLEHNMLLDILCGSYIVGSEDDVCEAVLRWLEANDSDLKMVEQMFQHINLNFVCLTCLKKRVRKSQNTAVKEVVFEMIDRETLRREEGRWPFALEIEFLIQRDSSGGFSQVFPDKYGIPFGKPCECKPARDRPLPSKMGKWTPADDGNPISKAQESTPAEDEDSCAKRSKWKAAESEETNAATTLLDTRQIDQQDLSAKACQSTLEDKSLSSIVSKSSSAEDENVFSKPSICTPAEDDTLPNRGAGGALVRREVPPAREPSGGQPKKKVSPAQLKKRTLLSQFSLLENVFTMKITKWIMQ